MHRMFAVTVSDDVVSLDLKGQAEVLFTITYVGDQPVVARAVVLAEPEVRDWIALEEPRPFLPGETHLLTARVRAPEGTPAGDYRFQLVVQDEAQPDDHYTKAPEVVLEAVGASPSASEPAAPAPRPWWPWAALAGTGLAILLTVVVGLRLTGCAEAPSEPAGSAVAEPVAPALDPCAEADCDDGDPCTVDACDPQAGCSHSPSTAPECNCPADFAERACPSTAGAACDAAQGWSSEACGVDFETCEAVHTCARQVEKVTVIGGFPKVEGGFGGVSEDHARGGACPDGTTRVRAQSLRRESGRGGSCGIAGWCDGNPRSCCTKMHYGVPAFAWARCDAQVVSSKTERMTSRRTWSP